ncbi:MAG: adenine phosphoribosyltransferase [Bdellovibrionota bacterium]
MENIKNELERVIKDIPNFPKEGVVFKDIMPLFLNPMLFKKTIKHMADMIAPYAPTHIVGMESRGFLFAVPLAYELSLSFVPARKKGKLPGSVVSQTYSLEYGTDTLEIQKDALNEKAKYFIFDDVLATGGTALAVNDLLKEQKCNVVGNLFLIELEFLNGRKKLLEKHLNLNLSSCLKY